MSPGRPPIPPGMDLTESRQGEARAVTITVTALAVVFVALHLGTRIKRDRISPDDYLLLASLVGVGRRWLGDCSCRFARIGAD